jgi:PAS domain S-box-containing protein
VAGRLLLASTGLLLGAVAASLGEWPPRVGPPAWLGLTLAAGLPFLAETALRALRYRRTPARDAAEGLAGVDARALREITLASPGILFRAVVPEDGPPRFVFLSDAVCAFAEWTPENAARKPEAWWELIAPEDRGRVERAYRDAARELAPLDVEYRVVTDSGRVKWVRSQSVSRRRPDGTPILDGVCTDQTERNRVEQAIWDAQARLELAVRGSGVGIWENDLPDGDFRRGRVRCVNVMEPLGHDPGEPTVDYATWESFIHPDDRDRVALAVRAYLAGESPEYEAEYRVRHEDGTYRWMLARATALREHTGRPYRLVGSRVDITDRKHAEEAFRDSEQRLELAAHGSRVGIWEVDIPDGSLDPDTHSLVYAVNVDETLGYKPGELTGDPAAWKGHFHPEDWPNVERTVRACLTGDSPGYEVEYRALHKEGTYRWILSRGMALRDGAGRPFRLVGSRVDITDRKRAEEELRQAKEAAEAADRAKGEFLANVSHEIRTPMNAILGMTELALDTPLPPELRDYLTVVKSSADSLLKLINDLLDFSKIEAGKLELDPDDFSLRSVLGETTRALALRAHKKGLELACQVQPEVPEALVGDAGRLRQVLLNLIGNAIKFTEEGEVVVRVEAVAPDDAHPHEPSDPAFQPPLRVRFSVRDTGIGISLEKQQKVFEAFEQEDTSTGRRYGGSGLGLTIAARLVALMGGRIEVESEPGAGSTFRFTASFGRSTGPPPGSPERPLACLRGLPVLVVDDNATSRQILETWLRGWQTAPTAVADGLMALDALWRAGDSGHPFGLVLLDARIPGTNALALAAKIRQNPALSSSKIILLTSDDHFGDVARFRDFGVAAHLMKPIHQEELLEAIYRVLSRPPLDKAEGRATPDASAPVTPPGAHARHLRVLVAEDTPFNQEFVGHLLGRLGHNVRVAGDGLEALAALREEAFDLMLLDVHMPGCDGFEVITALRRSERLSGRHLPVIAVTARAMKGDRERCLEAGMDGYLSKPFRAADLVSAIERLTVPRHGPDSTPPPPGPGGESLLDRATLLAACGGDPGLLQTLCRSFRANAPAALDRVRAAIEAQDAGRLREAAHQVRGIVSMFSARTDEAARRLEDLGVGGRFDSAAATLADLDELVRELDALLEDLPVEALSDGPG